LKAPEKQWKLMVDEEVGEVEESGDGDHPVSYKI